MASAGLREELSCSICLSIYKNPVMLTCGHNFCNDCIISVLDSQKKSGIYNCPECRRSFGKRPSPSKNLKLCNIVDHYCSALKDLEEVKINSFENLKCPVHDELFQYFCLTDSSFMCSTCTVESQHRRHQVELLQDAFCQKKRNLGDFLRRLTVNMGEYKEKLQQAQEQNQRVQRKACSMKERVTGLFKDIRLEMIIMESNILQEISRQEELICRRRSKQIEILGIEIDTLLKRKIQAEQLCDITDPVTLLKKGTINTNLIRKSFRIIPFKENLYEVKISVILERTLNSFTNILSKLKANRGFTLNTISDMILNVNTADEYIDLSHNLKNASYTDKETIRPYYLERFSTQQVLSINKFSSGKHYWEVNTSRTGDWSVGVTYNSIKRYNKTSFIGENHKSWCLSWFDNELIAEHDDKVYDVCDYAPDLGIYLDYEEGFLSFYELSNPIKLLHIFNTVFTEPLHVAVYLDDGAWVKM